MATPRTKILKLYLSSGITAEAKANLEILDTLGAVYFTDAASSVVIRAKESLIFRPRDPAVGGSGNGGTIDFGTASQSCTAFNVYSDVATFSKVIRLKNILSTNYVTLRYSSAISSDRVMTLDPQVDLSLELGGDFTTNGVLSFTGSGTYALPGTGTIVTTGAGQAFTNKTIDANLNTIIGLTSASISNSAAIPYSKLLLSNSIQNSDVSPSAAIAYSKLSLTSSITSADIDASNPIDYSKLFITGKLVNGDISTSAGITYNKLNITGSIQDVDIAPAAAIALSKLASSAPNQAVITDINGKLTSTPVVPAALGGTGISSSATFPLSGIVLTADNSTVVTNKSLDGGTNVFTNIPYSSLILSGSINGGDISPSAAIPYTKLNLTGNIVNADVSVTAAIHGSKIVPEFGFRWVQTYNGLQMIEGALSTYIRAAISGQTQNLTFALPNSYGVNGQILSTNGSGQFVWASVLTDSLSQFHVDIGNSGNVREAANTFLLGDVLAAPLTGLTIKAGVITNSKISATAAIEFVKLQAGAFNTVAVFNGTGVLGSSAVTPTELGYLTGVTSGIQSQLDGKQPTGSYQTTALNSQHVWIGNGSNLAVAVDTSTLGDVTASTALFIKSGVITNTQIATSAAIALSKLQTGTADRAVQFNASGVLSASAVSSTELGYMAGVTGAIQTQLNSKQPTGNYITSLTGEATASGPGAASITLNNAVVIAKTLTGFTSGANLPIQSTDTILGAFQKTQGQIAAINNLFTTMKEPTGFVNKADVLLAYDPATRTVSLTPVGASFEVHVGGKAFVFSSAQSVVHADVTAAYFAVINDTGTLTISTTQFVFGQEAFVAFVNYNTALTPKGYAIDELHSNVMDWTTHLELHERVGTYVVSGAVLDPASYLVRPGTPTNAGNRPGIITGIIADEDNRTTLAALPDEGPYTKMNKTGAAGTFVWSVSAADFVHINGVTNRAQYNQFTAEAWQLTDIANGDFANYYLFCIPSVGTGTNAGFRFVWLPGQAVFGSLANARLESVTSLDLTGLPATEIVPRYKVTIRRSDGYATVGRWRIEEVTLITGTASSLITVSGNTVSDHRALSFREAADQHPTSAISFPAQSPATPLSFDQVMDRVWSAGALVNVNVVSNGDGTVSISAADFVLRNANSITAPTRIYNVPAISSLALTDNAVNYIYASYNAGVPIYKASVNITDVPGTDNVLYALASRQGTNIDVLTLPFFQTDFMVSTEKRLFNVYGIQHASGALLDCASYTISVTAGQFYFVNNFVASPAFDTGVASTFTLAHRSAVPGEWIRTSSQTTIPVAQWDDNSGTLQAAPAGHYVNSWVYIVLNNPSRLLVVQDQNTHSSLDLALREQPPSTTPAEVSKYSTGKLVGKVITQQGSSFCESYSPFLTYFTAPSAPIPGTKFIQTFGTGDWVDGGSFYSISVTAITHLKGLYPEVQVQENVGGGVFRSVLVDAIDTAADGAVAIKVSKVPDSRFIGRAVIS